MGGNCNMDDFVMWANWITYSTAPARGLCLYDALKRTHTMPVMPFLCIYMYLHVFTHIFANVRITHA